MPDPRIGLVLGGGGARGFGHVGVMEALDDLGLKPVAIAGTSIGAIMGAARAGGLDGRQIREASLETFKDSKAALARLWSLRPRSVKDVFTGRIGSFDPERLLEAFLDPYLKRDFAELEIPLSVVATDFYGARDAVFRSGDLRKAIAASMALPTIFRPVLHDGRALMDGGITNPVPVDALPLDIDLVIAVDVVALPEPREANEVPGTFGATAGAIQLLMASLADAKFQIRPPDVLIRPPVGRFHVLDFLKAREVLEVCDGAKDDMKRRIARVVESPTLTITG